MVRNIHYILLLALMAGFRGGGGIGHADDDGLDPEEALQTFELHPGLQIELLAAEPLVADPIDMEIDEVGRLYVLEDHSYPDNWTGVDKIKLLRDVDGDGQMDEAIVFADSLVQAMGIMRWKKGLIVTAPPDVIYLEDTDGDGRADVKQTVLTGFHHGDGEGDVNNPTYGLDNWIYLGNNQTSGQDVAFAERPEGPRIPAASINRNIRFRPDTFELETLSSRTQFGLTFDRWGHLLNVNNRDHIYQEIIAARYLARNPDLLVAGATESISDHEAAAKVFPITANPEFQILTDVGEITAACGITYYDGGLLPAPFHNVAFVAEPAHNLVHVDRLRRDGPALVAERIRPYTEFLASTDAWFRPVNMYVGPDGALYVVDYYRKIIEGPTWLSDEVLASGTIYHGVNRGRIYRITPSGASPADWTTGVDLAEASNRELVRHLDDSNTWWRLNAQRLLVDRAAVDVVPDLERMALGDEDATGNDIAAAGRLHALWTLEGLGRLSEDVIRRALKDPDPGIRENAIRLAELHLLRSASAAADAEAVSDALLTMAPDPDAGVRFQLLLTLGYVDSPRSAAAREEILFRDIDHEWMQVAALTAPSAQEGNLLETLIGRFEAEHASFIRRLSGLAGAHRSADQIQALLQKATNPDQDASWQASVLEGLAHGLERRNVRVDVESVIGAFFDHASSDIRAAALQVLEATGVPQDSSPTRAIEIATDRTASSDRRAQVVAFLRLADPAPHAALLMELVDPREPADVQMAALRTLGAVPGTAVSRLAMERWPILTQEVRDAALEVILARPFDLNRIEQLLDAIEAGTVMPASIGWLDQVTLMRDIPADMMDRARDLITDDVAPFHDDYLQALDESIPHPDRGRAVFNAQCARCHALGDIAPGAHVGPDLMSVRGWGAADIVDQTIRPSKAIARGYDLFRITLQNGETAAGIIASETANALTLRNEFGQESTIARSAIASVENLNASLMPSNFAELISPQEMADLVAFIRIGE